MIDKFEFLEKIIQTLNMVTVSGGQSVVALAEAYKMLATLKKGLREEDTAKAKTIDALKDTIKRLEAPDVASGGDVIGGEHIDIDFKNDEVKQDD